LDDFEVVTFAQQSLLCYVMLWNELVLGAVMSQSNCKDT